MREQNIQFTFQKKLESLGYIDDDILIELERSKNKEIDALLQTASKTPNAQRGYPDFIISSKKHKDTIIIVECKSDFKKHSKGDIEKNKAKTAVEGVLWYAKFLKVKFNVICLAVSGLNIDNLKISTFIWSKDKDLYQDLVIDKILKFDKYIDKAKNLAKKEPLSEKELKKVSEKLNDFMRENLEVTEERRALLAGSILIALDDTSFNLSYYLENSQKALVKRIYDSVVNSIETKIKDSEKINIIKSELSFIKYISPNDKGNVEFRNGAITELTNIFRDEIHPYYKQSDIDVIGYFFTTFLKYATNGGGDLGVVLTPSHIADLFSRIGRIDKNSKIFDPCMGTGTFLVDAWKKMHILNKKNGSLPIFGVEFKPQMFVLAIMNMILHKDGSSKLIFGSCFDKKIQDFIKSKNCNIGMINPPYSHSTNPEIKFVENMLDALAPGAIGISIIPVNAVSNQSKKHGNLLGIKELLLQKHKLIASIQMPVQLFYPKGTETLILVFKAHRAHNYEENVWFAKLDDGYEMIKQQGRVRGDSADDKIDKFICAYYNKSNTSFSFNQTITCETQWVYSVIKESDYTLEQVDFENTVKDYNAFLYLNGYNDEL